VPSLAHFITAVFYMHGPTAAADHMPWWAYLETWSPGRTLPLGLRYVVVYYILDGNYFVRLGNTWLAYLSFPRGQLLSYWDWIEWLTCCQIVSLPNQVSCNVCAHVHACMQCTCDGSDWNPLEWHGTFVSSSSSFLCVDAVVIHNLSNAGNGL